MPYIPDALDMYNRHEAEQEAWLNKRPVCSECGHHIQDDYCYQFNGELICQNCLETYHEKMTEDFCE